MQIRITYVGTLNGVAGMWCGWKPEGAIITEERPCLYADSGKTLWLISVEEPYEVGGSVWLKDTTADDYEERDIEQSEEEVSVDDLQ